jgi:Chitobiase/beta-hexosaminidase C-terminal domain/Fibronectin type III domain
VSLQSKAPGRRARRYLNRRVAMTAVAGVIAGGATAAGFVADAAVPAFPDNLVVFPDRDFISVEGYQNHIGETALVEVTRDGQLIGSAKGAVEEGDVAFEINHPGGICWGNDTTLQVTPDIRPGDKVNISFNGVDAGDTTVQNAYVTGDATLSGNTLTVRGFAGPGVNQAQTEQRIINPDLVDTEIGRRDIRAIPGPLTPAPKGGYSSALTFEGDQFTATYVFTDPANALIASKADLGERAMAWQNEDADANRQGLTIAEYGEAGGPGMGGCPAGPGDAGAPQPGSANVVRSATDKSKLSVTWKPTDQLPGAAAVTGYSVEAIQQNASTLGEKGIVGKRAGATATHVDLSGLDPAQGYDLEVRSMAGDTVSRSFTVQVPTPTDLGDVTPPALTATPAVTGAITTASTITLASEAGADIYYTLDGSAVITGDLPSSTAKRYTAPIAISGKVDLNAVAFDRAGNFGTFAATYQAPPDSIPAPAVVSTITGTAGQANVTLSWAAPEAGVNGYGIQAYVFNAAGAKVASGALKTTTAKTITINSLNPGTEYWFTVKAQNGAGYGPESTLQGPFIPTRVTDSVSIGTAKWKSGDFRVTGSGSAVGAFLEVHNANAAGTGPGTTVLARGQVEPPVAPATIGTYDIRARNANAPAANPGKVFVVSENGGVAGPFVVAG